MLLIHEGQTVYVQGVKLLKLVLDWLLQKEIRRNTVSLLANMMNMRPT